jgi:hypothetical protein
VVSVSVFKFIGPDRFLPNAGSSASFALAQKCSGQPMLQYGAAAGQAANTNVILQIPLEPEIDTAWGQTLPLTQIHLAYYVSALSAGVTPLISANFKVYEVRPVAGSFYTVGVRVTSAGTAAAVGLPNSRTSATFVPAGEVSATAWGGEISNRGSAIADIGVSSIVDTFTNIRVKDADAAEQYTRPYRPRLGTVQTTFEISASLGASALIEFYGCFAEYG